ncbi:hypothetical protein [Breoghania sp. JC706]|uniref:hypothetical protein n=1 Tax=Breoghania sp. JC706 TaxID=3117732 RepID=UPI00300AA9CD
MLPCTLLHHLLIEVRGKLAAIGDAFPIHNRNIAPLRRQRRAHHVARARWRTAAPGSDPRR